MGIVEGTNVGDVNLPEAEVIEERFDSVPKITDYQPHDKQSQAHAAFLVNGYQRGTLFWGRQVGKSLWSVKHLEMAAVLKQGQYFIVFNTHKHAKDVMWRQYLHVIPKELIADTNSTELIITFNYCRGAFYFPGIGWQYIEHDPDMPPSTIQLLGSDYAYDHTGRKAHGMIFDEYQDQDPNNWETVYRHFFTTTKGWAAFMGTARGYNHWYDRLQYSKDQYDKSLKGSKKTWFYLEATWRDNPVIDPEYMEEQRHEAEETGQLDTFMQEVELQFRTVQGSVYPMFDRKVHVLKPDGTREEPRNDKVHIPYESGTLFIVWDFGWVEGHPTAVNFILIDDHQRMFIIDEIHGTQIAIDDVIDMIRMKASGYRITHVIADSARPDLIEIARSKHLPVIGAPKRQGSVPAGIQLMAQKLNPKQQMLGLPEPDMYITSNCKHTIYQLENYRYRENKLDRPASDLPVKMNDDHPDAIRYLLLYLKYGLMKTDEPIKARLPMKTNQYGLPM
jgi:phage terminase large subunit